MNGKHHSSMIRWKPATFLFSLAFSALFLFSPASVVGQEGNIWYFGNLAGLNFNMGGTPTPLTNGAMVTNEGCAVITNSEGNIKFYTDGRDIWDSNHNKMPNGLGLKGSSSATQSAIIVPLPDGVCEKYYVFTTPSAEGNPNDGLNYSLVDMTLPGNGTTGAPLGDVVPGIKNMLLQANVAEKLTAVKDDAAGFWVIAHGFGSVDGQKFYAYHITSAGLNTTPVVSTIGTTHTGGGGPGTFNMQGQMKVSPDGTKLALAVTKALYAELFNFSRTTGIVTEIATGGVKLNLTSNGQPYGVEFSPNSQVLYISTTEAPASEDDVLYSFQLSALTAGGIFTWTHGTELDRSISPRVQNNHYFGALQLGPDHKIYVARNAQSFIGVVNDPNNYSNPNYVKNGQAIGNTCGIGLPTVIQGDFSCHPSDSCQTDSLAFNTGWDQYGGVTLDLGTTDNDWYVISDPMSNTVEPRPAYVIPPYYPGDAWADPQPKSTWISSYPTADNDVNGHYIFESYFCLADSIGASLCLNIRADDTATVYLNGHQIGSTGLLSFKPYNQPVTMCTQNPGLFKSGKNIIRVDVHNTDARAMGFDVVGTLRGRIPRYWCCCSDSTGGITGFKWNDLNGNGVKDAGEPILPNWPIQLSNGRTTTTDSLGNYYFLFLPPGEYTVSEGTVTGWTQTHPPTRTHSINLNGCVIIDSVNFGNVSTGTSSCDSLIRASLDTACCQYNFTIQNNVGSPIAHIAYSLDNGTINSIITTPCISPSPVAIGSTSGVLQFIPACPGNIQVTLSSTPTTATGWITVTLILVHQNGDTCRLFSRYRCERAPLVQCDSVSVAPFIFAGLDASGRTFTVHNVKIPASNISWIEIIATPPPTFLNGGGLTVDGTPQSWGFPYVRIPNSGSIAATGSVSFNLGIDYTFGWTGTITLIIHHADGDSCTMTYGPWTATPPTSTGGIVIHSRSNARYYVDRLQLHNLNPSKNVKWISMQVVDKEDRIVAGSGTTWIGTVAEPGYALLRGYEQGQTEALFTFTDPVLPGRFSGYFTLVVARDSSKAGTPIMRWTSYDEQGNAIARDTIMIQSATTAINTQPMELAPNDFALLSSYPNPANGSVSVTYSLNRAMKVRLEILDLLGRSLATLHDQYETAGQQTRMFQTGQLVSGQYYLRFSSGDRSQLMPVTVVR